MASSFFSSTHQPKTPNLPNKKFEKELSKFAKTKFGKTNNIRQLLNHTYFNKFDQTARQRKLSLLKGIEVERKDFVAKYLTNEIKDEKIVIKLYEDDRSSGRGEERP